MKTFILCVLCLCAQTWGQYTKAEATSASQRLRLSAERATLRFELSADYDEWKREQEILFERFRDVCQQIASKVRLNSEYRDLEELSDALSVSLKSASEDERIKIALQIHDVRARMWAIANAAQQGDPEYIDLRAQIRENAREAVRWAKARRYAVIADPQWMNDWERLQSARIRYVENSVWRAREPDREYTRRKVVWFHN